MKQALVGRLSWRSRPRRLGQTQADHSTSNPSKRKVLTPWISSGGFSSRLTTAAARKARSRRGDSFHSELWRKSYYAFL
jgi:hypothetical protein